MLDSDTWHLMIAAFVGVVLPISLVVIRQTVKSHRQEIIQDLATVFSPPGLPAGDRLIPSFEFVKFKYFLPENYGSGVVRRPKDFANWAWLVAIIPFGVVSGLGAWICLKLLALSLPKVLAISSIPVTVLFRDVACAAFLGAYLAAMRSLAQAIHNFDLSPSLFIASTLDMLAGIALALIIVRASDAFFNNKLPVIGAVRDEVSILIAFAAGFLPQAAQRAILSRSRLWNFKQDNEQIYRYFKAIPLELIDGIDTKIRDRLSDFHIISTQNLAAANPLMLFVETPYGVYQIMDWVAQAQLCASVGPVALAELWKFGVRTIFDLERLALDPRSHNSELLKAVGSVLFPKGTRPPSEFDEKAIRASIQMRLEDPYVHRLRQIYIQVGQRIGSRYGRFSIRATEGLPVVYADDSIFCKPDIINMSHAQLDVRPGDKLLIVGGSNDGKLVTISMISETSMAVHEGNIINSGFNTQQVEVKILKIGQEII
ncbi:hypothetical protein RHSP_79178 [Rhizobium freirei PRF 81]|uniref:Transmembrane protein n=2 Tax=Rhizobium freirei TaxID=1353277 RepID=N6UXK6_9HYPH|nr:hypothetical protein RHSP_79178 [Rhizobium freirei PRF 81]